MSQNMRATALRRGTPRQQRERGGIRKSPHIAFRVRGVSLNSCPVEPDSQLQGILQIVHRDGKAFEVAENIGEPEANEFHVKVACAAEHVLTFGCMMIS